MRQYNNYGKSNFNLAKYYCVTLFSKLFYSILIVLSISLMIISHKNKAFDIYFRETVIYYTRPAVNIVEYPVNMFIQLIWEIKDFILAKKENKILKKENEELAILYKQSINIQNENENLKQLINFVGASRLYNYKASKIYYAGKNNLTNQIIIKAGTQNNLVENSLVLGDKGGVIGRIVNLGETLSYVLLLTDINSKIPVVIVGEQRSKGILTGDGSNQPKILYLEKNHNIKKDDLIYTTGDNQLTVSGLFIGKVNKVKDDQITVKLYENIKKIDNVLIVDVDQK
jgi:rod shape-determining protein MreC